MNPIIVALDVSSGREARELVSRLAGAVGCFKIGMELYAAEGVSLVDELLEAGHRVFLDLKFYDIPETVKRATAQVARRGVHFLTVHGSQAVMRAAVEGRGESELKLLGVTVLTSFDESDLADLGYGCRVSDLVALRVQKAKEAGLDGVVCSPLEASQVRGTLGPQALVVTPGVRSLGSAQGDQKRVATPAEAIRNGASHLVIGRQITQAADPKAEALRILEEIAGAGDLPNDTR
ncbi:MAG: orotidine-5'-phosphate decarboxylase [Bryobacteraceae bacterium]|nr:orotidine-5'-phosphate decarboxylase [Bryobacteraceae bacterium]MDW8377128.1 orotidine-5'-phosphate decarboxylase [Bryobacterales bacterium]